MRIPFRILAAIALFLCLVSCGNRRHGTASSRSAAVPETHGRETVLMDTASFFTVSELSDEVFSRMQGKSFKEGGPVSRQDLRYLKVLHKNLEGETLHGEMVCNKLIADQLRELFLELFRVGYPIERMRLVDDYDADDAASMMDNNTSCFNCRFIQGTSMASKHSLGLAVDINPLYNPSLKHGIVRPSCAIPYTDRDASFPYKIVRGDPCHQAFLSRGFVWGGGWASSKDWQHFEKPWSEFLKRESL